MRTEFKASLLSPKKGEKKIWLDFIPYAQQLFGEKGDEIWRNPVQFLSMYNQAQQLLKPDVVSIPIHRFYSVYLKTNVETMEQWQGKKTTFILRKLLALEEPRDKILEVLEGIINLYGNRYPIVIEVPSPYGWIKWLKEETGADIQSITSNEIDSAAMYLADFMRGFSASDITGIILEESLPSSPKEDNLFELYQSIFNIAEHYKWVVGLRLKRKLDHFQGLIGQVDLILLEEKELLSEASIPCGCGLVDEFWMETLSVDELAGNDLFFGVIPENAHPETVLNQLIKIRSMH